VFFIFLSCPSASFANCQLTSVDSATGAYHPLTNCLSQHTFWFSVCRQRHCLRRRRRRRRRCRHLRHRCRCYIRLLFTAPPPSLSSTAAVRSHCQQSLSAIAVSSACRRRCCLRRSGNCVRRCHFIRLAASAAVAIIYSAAAILVVRSRCLQPPSATIVSRCCLCLRRRSPQCRKRYFHSRRCFSASSAAFGIPPNR